jgi:hypothetical protein
MLCQKKILTMIYSLWVKDQQFKCDYKKESTGKMELETSSQFSFEEAGIKNSADQKPALHKVINRQNITV